ncbi:thiamine pyrophosphate-dependent enzyme [Agarivorans sp. MS3-6]
MKPLECDKLKPNLADLTTAFKRALLIRQAEYSLLDLYKEGLISGTIHTCIGQELIGAIIGQTYQEGDYIFSNHRGHGHFLGTFPEQLSAFFAELLGKETGLCGGHGGSQHLHHDGFTSNGILGGTAPIALGTALAQKLSKKGKTIVFLGDGAMGEGVIYEALNMASLYKVPLYIVCEKNHIAQTTATDLTTAGSLLDRAKAFGINTFSSTTLNPEGLVESVNQAIDTLKHGPVFHLIETQRLMPHSKSDDTRSPDSIKQMWLNDPLDKWHFSFSDSEQLKQKEQVQSLIQEAIKQASSADHATRFPPVYTPASSMLEQTAELSEQPLVERINQALHTQLKNPLSMVFGEDVLDPYGGAFKVSRNLSEKYPSQVLSTPISEAAIAGMGIGLALAGRRPIAEIMFGDFLGLCFDQLFNHASKIPSMFNGKVSIPLIIRTTSGGGRAYGATHSQAVEGLLLNKPNIQSISCHPYLSTKQLEDSFASVESTTIIYEPKLAYQSKASSIKGHKLFTVGAPWPDLFVQPMMPAYLTLICYGPTLDLSLKAAQELLFKYELPVEVISLCRLDTPNWELIERSVKHTEKVLIVEESHSADGLGYSIINHLHQHNQEIQGRTLCAHFSPLSAAPQIESQQLVSSSDVINCIVNWSQ